MSWYIRGSAGNKRMNILTLHGSVVSQLAIRNGVVSLEAAR
jgi:hypothetical protein